MFKGEKIDFKEYMLTSCRMYFCEINLENHSLSMCLSLDKTSWCWGREGKEKHSDGIALVKGSVI